MRAMFLGATLSAPVVVKGRPRTMFVMFEAADIVSVDLAQVNTSRCRSFEKMFNNIVAPTITGLDTITLSTALRSNGFNQFISDSIPTADYDAFLQRLSDECDAKGITGIELGMGTATYTNTAAHDNLVNTHGWVITDGGPA